MTLDPQVVSLLKDDFDFFFESEEWFRQAELPHRRGYLLHGPPGNGKSTAVRCMLSSRGLTAYTLRLFHPHTDDSDLDDLFDLALKNRPAIVLLEDIDRAFPKSGESKTNISLQQLLNTLDGIASGEGIIVVATANEPSLLDPAILRRPGRFDRVVSFPNPNRELRKSFFLGRRIELTAGQADNIARASHGFSFAQLREAYIAGQKAFERKGTILENDLLLGIAALRNSSTAGSRASHAAGFQAEAEKK
jgi:SpoVK/Ycf46/Vps4 family AAA+-type ATPase